MNKQTNEMPNLVPVINALRTVEHMGELEMGQPDVWLGDNHSCGTVHCVAGWYAVAKINSGEIDTHSKDYIGYEVGVEIINEDIGVDLKSWAVDNPELWGNEYGNIIWGNRVGWNNADNLTQVIHHLERVQDRIAGELL